MHKQSPLRRIIRILRRAISRPDTNNRVETITSKTIQVSESWPGFSSIRRIIVFGDSYSSVGYQGEGGNKTPTTQDPLGVPFPGLPGTMWNEADTPNWIGHLITKYAPAPRYDPHLEAQDETYSNNPLLVYDYAVGGATIRGITDQIHDRFFGDSGVGFQPDWARWDSRNALFITWVGINDCAYARDHERTISTLFSLQDELYKAGARNFLFIDVPPIHRSPAGTPKSRPAMSSLTFDNWNTELRTGAKTFSDSHPDATILIFSSYEFFNRFLDDYKAFGFDASDVHEPFSKIWKDLLHPTSKVHDLIAKELADFLSGVSISISS